MYLCIFGFYDCDWPLFAYSLTTDCILDLAQHTDIKTIYSLQSLQSGRQTSVIKHTRKPGGCVPCKWWIFSSCCWFGFLLCSSDRDGKKEQPAEFSDGRWQELTDVPVPCLDYRRWIFPVMLTTNSAWYCILLFGTKRKVNNYANFNCKMKIFHNFNSNINLTCWEN